jgi:hypothetical protein
MARTIQRLSPAKVRTAKAEMWRWRQAISSNHYRC